MEGYEIKTGYEKVTIVSPAPAVKEDLTDEIRKTMIEEALAVLPQSYAPFSHYNVAAAVLMSSGKIYTGVNIESALLSCTICAERNAIFHAAARGERKIIAIAVVGGIDCKLTDYCTPCGVCRQVMRDFARPDDMYIICAKSPEDYIERTLGEMLPESFGPETL